jgi:uncharacterized protein (DUF952 family)
MTTNDRIYHICRREEWLAGQEAGRYAGSAQDKADGFIHFSTGDQIVASAAKHRAGQTGLVILEVEARLLRTGLRWEPSRDGQLFPHLYKALPTAAVARVADLPLGSDGRHVFPWGLDAAASGSGA